MTGAPTPPTAQRNQPWIARPETSCHAPGPLSSVPLSNSNHGENVHRRGGVAMWLFFLAAWFVLLAAIAFLAPQAFGLDVTHLPALFASQPMPQRLAIGAILVAGLVLIGTSVWRLSRQD